MKHTHIFFSLSFLLACSFAAHAMEEVLSCSSMTLAKEGESSSSGSYLELVKQAAKILDENKRGIPVLVSLRIESNRPCCQKVLLKRKNGGKEIDTALEAILKKDWQGGDGAEQYIIHLAATNAALNVSEQIVDENGNLITTFKEPKSIITLKLIYGMPFLEIEDIEPLD